MPRNVAVLARTKYRSNANRRLVSGGPFDRPAPIDDGVWTVYFGPLKLGRLLEKHMRIEDAFGRLKCHL